MFTTGRICGDSRVPVKTTLHLFTRKIYNWNVDTSSDVAHAIVMTSCMDTSSDVAHAIVMTSYMDTSSDVAHLLW
jgi:hypothetical protein